MTFALPLLAVLLLGGPPLEARALAAIDRLCPAVTPGDRWVAVMHARAARAIGVVAADESEAIALIAAGCHESRFETQWQQHDGPAVTWYQLEVPRAQRLELLVDDVAATRAALAAIRHGWEAYACGGSCPAKAAELARYEVSARWAWSATAP